MRLAELPFLAPHFVDSELARGHVPPELETTLDLDLQRVLERQVKHYVEENHAVGLANARNPVALIVPCHRVIGADGSLIGYGGGLHSKRLLLDLEAGVRPLL